MRDECQRALSSSPQPPVEVTRGKLRRTLDAANAASAWVDSRRKGTCVCASCDECRAVPARHVACTRRTLASVHVLLARAVLRCTALRLLPVEDTRAGKEHSTLRMPHPPENKASSLRVQEVLAIDRELEKLLHANSKRSFGTTTRNKERRRRATMPRKTPGGVQAVGRHARTRTKRAKNRGRTPRPRGKTRQAHMCPTAQLHEPETAKAPPPNVQREVPEQDVEL